MANPSTATPPAAEQPRQVSYFQAIFEALQEEMTRDARVVLIGEDLALFTRTGLLPGELAGRIFSAPISENGFAGVGVGAALTGLRPVVDFTIASFVYLAMDQIVNQAGKLRAMTGGQASVPVVFRASMWHEGSNAAQHSDRPYPMLMNAPGLKVAVPATPADVKGILKAAIRDDDPVVIFEDNSLWFQNGPIPAGDHLVPLGVAEVLASEGVSTEVVDPRSLVPLDRQTILDSVAKTGRLVVVDPAHRTGGAAAEIAALVAEEAFDCLHRPILRVATPDVPIPFSPALEEPLYPGEETILSAVRKLF
jgi:pyruvate dehydrogenase E1 component beta subunit